MLITNLLWKKTPSSAAWPANFAFHRLVHGPEVLLQQVAILSRHLPDTWCAWLSQNVLHTGQYMRVAVFKHETLKQCWFNVASTFVFSGNVTYRLNSRACVIMAGWQELGYLVISKRYCGTMMVLHLQCRPTIKPMPSKRYSIETSHVQREQTVRPLGPDTDLLEVWRNNPIWPPTKFSAPYAFIRDDTVSDTILW